MPELPEVETVRRGLVPVMKGAKFLAVEAGRKDLRWPLPKDFAKRLTGRRVERLNRRAKYLLAALDDGEVLVMHLGMSGSFRITHKASDKTPGEFHHPRGKAGTHDHVVFHMSSGVTVTFNDPRRFGAMLMVRGDRLAEDKLFRALGPEPLDAAFTTAVLAQACDGKKTSLKAALLDQRVVAGLGNIYVCEALFRAHLSPKRMAAVLSSRGKPTAAARGLVKAIRQVLSEAIKAGGSSLRNYVKADGELGNFQHKFRVYDREGAPCPTPRCKGKIRRIVQTGRSTFYCPVCQH
ncbi:MAG TPA: bifunctional DNA-formamidopyrimidine glycosylase/DNA-(apurinic or apyrimidinic site) lyase [Xanthobacteraceae bacterium]